MLAVAPVPAGAVLVMPLPARVADHALYCAAKLESTAVMTRISPGGLLLASGLPVACGFRAARTLRQAAFARRMRRRRSAERSSSLRPPHVPYFSGRPTA